MPKIMASGGTEANKIIYVSSNPVSVKCDSGSVDIYEYNDGSRSSTSAATVTPGSPKGIYGRGYWDIVRSATTVNVYTD